uniref:Uncharacterized protein n=1 Tax=Anguilla anguilla TaxID=7936 RepID=A0A0E9WF46_ANGAN
MIGFIMGHRTHIRLHAVWRAFSKLKYYAVKSVANVRTYCITNMEILRWLNLNKLAG